MADIATLGLRVDSSQVARGSIEVDRFTATAGRAHAANENLARGWRNVAQSAAALPGPMGVVSARLATLAAGAAATAGTVAALAVAIGGKSVAAFAQLEVEQATYNAVLRATGFAAGKTGDDIEDLATSIRKATGATEGEVRKAAAVLATFGGLAGEQFDQALRLSRDLSVVMGGDMASAARVLGRALEDPIDGMTMLRRGGILLSEAQKQQIKNFVETGQSAKAMQVILDEGARRMGGAGAAQGGTIIGSFKNLSEATNNWLEGIGSNISNAIRLRDVLNGIAGAVDRANKSMESAGTPQGRLSGIDAALAERRARPGTMIPGIDAANTKEIIRLEGQRAKVLGEVAEAEAKVAAERSKVDAGAAAAAANQYASGVGKVVNSLREEAEELNKTTLQRAIDTKLREAATLAGDKLSKTDEALIAAGVRSNFLQREGSGITTRALTMRGAAVDESECGEATDDGDQHSPAGAQRRDYCGRRRRAVRRGRGSFGDRPKDSFGPSLARPDRDARPGDSMSHLGQPHHLAFPHLRRLSGGN